MLGSVRSSQLPFEMHSRAFAASLPIIAMASESTTYIFLVPIFPERETVKWDFHGSVEK